MSRRRKLLIAAAGLVALIGAAIALVHTSAVQRRLIGAVVAAIEETSGIQVEIENPRFRLWPARFVAEGVVVSVDEQSIAAIERVEARWRWAGITASPRRIEAIFIEGVDLDLRDPPPMPTTDAGTEDGLIDPWRAVEIGQVRITDGRGAAAFADLAGAIEGVRVEGAMVDGRAMASVETGHCVLERFDRRLDFDEASVKIAASSSGVVVDGLEIGGDVFAVRGSGEFGLAGDAPSSADFSVRADVARALAWWDPNLVTGLDPAGILDLDAHLALIPDGGFVVTASHTGDRLFLAGYGLDQLDLAYSGGIPEIHLAGEDWGSATVAVAGDGLANVSGRLRNAPVERVLAFVAPEVAAAVPGPVTLAGEIDGTLSYPFALDSLSGRVDLLAETTKGSVRLVIDGAKDRWTVRDARVELPGIAARAVGTISPGGLIEGTLDLETDDASALASAFQEWLPELQQLGLAGGPLNIDTDLTGSLADPRFQAKLEWISPSIMGRVLDQISINASGGPAAVEWVATINPMSGSSATLDGVIDLQTLAVAGQWRIDVDDLSRVAGLVGELPEAMAEVGGKIGGAGDFALDGKGWSVSGRVYGSDLGAGDWRVESLDAVFAVDPDRFALASLRSEIFDGSVTGSAEVGLAGFDSPLTVELQWTGLDLSRLKADLRGVGEGLTDGAVSVQGTMAHPTGVVELQWAPRDPTSPVPALSLAGSLESGVLRVVSEDVTTGVGAFVADLELPLGIVPRPSWLWPEAPIGAVEISASGRGLRSDAIVSALGIEALPINATSGLILDASWQPSDPEATRVLAEFHDLRVSHIGGEVTASGPVIVSVSGDRIEVAPVVLTGPQTKIELGGVGSIRTGRFDGTLDAVLSPQIARLIPYPIQIYEPIHLSMRFGGTPKATMIDVSIQHPGGALVMRDPALQIRDLTLSAEIVDGVVWINDGRAEVNQGTIEIGGGWDPTSGQGIVAEIQDVVVFVGGILSQWSGEVAIEPQPDMFAKVVGDLNLVAGLWDQNVSLGSALFGPGSLDLATDDPLFGIGLDLGVRGRGIVRVENNLGRFDARWDVLRVTGSAAQPKIKGEITIAPGGRFSLAGQRVTVRRGNLVFTGDPDVDPIIEIVPDSDFAVFGGEEGTLNPTSMATEALVGGLAGVLGFENETLQPAEISVETEKDPTSHFMFGQRVSHNVALFFATNTTDVQDRTSMLQLWNLPGLKGLAFQAYDKTLNEELGGNVIQRFQWGGSSLYDDRATIRKIRLMGDWPLRARRLKKAIGFRRGQPYESFLLFVAKVRMEKELAGEGYQDARVTMAAVESNNAWTMTFECEPGTRQAVIFEGYEPPRNIRQEVTALYSPPPLEEFGFRNMAKLLHRHFDAEGFPDADIVVERRGDLIVADVARNGLTELSGPVLEGVPEPVAQVVRRKLGSASELAFLAADEERAAEMIRGVLVDQGYDRAEVASVSKVATGTGHAEVRAVVELGPQAVVSELIVTGSDPLGLTVADDFPLTIGSPLDRLAVDLAASELRGGYDAAGYSDAEISGTMVEDPENWWRVTLNIVPGLQRTVEALQINGLKHTSRRSIAAGITVKEGEILRNTDLDRTAIQVANFSPIERVDVRTTPQGTGGVNVELDVVEKPRWTTEVGGGWSSERGVQARFGVRDDNLLGRGFGLDLRGRWDQTEWLGFIVASLPPLPGKKLSFNSTVGYTRGEAPYNPDLAEDEASWSIGATRRLGSGRKGTLTDAYGDSGQQVTAYYRYTRTHTYNKVPPLFPWEEVDSTLGVGLVGARFVRDRFDYPFDPKSGHGFLLDIGYSGDVVGSELDYWTGLGNGSIALGVLGSSTWIQSLRIGVAQPLQGTDLDDSVKLFAGGQGSVRGFDRNTVGPVEYVFGGGLAPAGGEVLFILNEELRIPVWGGFRAAVFADIGQVWESWGQADLKFSVGAGVGIRWATPIGPLWADVAWPLVNTGISSTKPKFYVGIGRPF